MAFDPEGYLYFSVGDRGNRDENPQNLDNHCGKIHRIHDDGSIPDDNPFVSEEGAMPSIYSYGHRNPQGMAVHPTTGAIWTHEHGPRGGDEVNIIRKGDNYGWPVISYGINYDGTSFTQITEKEGMEQPLHYWVPSIAPCGAAFVASDRYPGWEGDFLVGSLRFEYLNRCQINGDEIASEEILMENIGRLRSVATGPDGYVYVGVEDPGAIYRLMPMTDWPCCQMKDNFSGHATDYARYRPTYPDGVFRFLYEQLTHYDAAWDCGTGNGQVAVRLAEQFEQVYATDLSENQVAQAPTRANITYRVERAEDASFSNQRFDLITVAQAIHWFDFDAFYTVVPRVLRPGGFLAIMGYNLMTVDDSVDAIIHRLYEDILGDDYWDPERKHIEERYQTIPFPFRGYCCTRV